MGKKCAWSDLNTWPGGSQRAFRECLDERQLPQTKFQSITNPHHWLQISSPLFRRLLTLHGHTVTLFPLVPWHHLGCHCVLQTIHPLDDSKSMFYGVPSTDLQKLPGCSLTPPPDLTDSTETTLISSIWYSLYWQLSWRNIISMLLALS